MISQHRVFCATWKQYIKLLFLLSLARKCIMMTRLQPGLIAFLYQLLYLSVTGLTLSRISLNIARSILTRYRRQPHLHCPTLSCASHSGKNSSLLANQALTQYLLSLGCTLCHLPGMILANIMTCYCASLK